MTNPLATKAVLASVHIRRWTGRRLDKQISDEVNQGHASEEDVNRVNKLLLPKTAFAEVHAVTRAARKAHEVMTLPWMVDGTGILPTVKYDEFATRFREFREEFNKAATLFNRNYQTHLAAAPKRMGKAYKAEDYPDPKRVPGMFSFHVAILPCPDVADFRVTLSKEQLADTEIRLKQALDDAMKEPFRRISHVVGRMAERLKNADHTFRDSLVSNIKELVEILPAFNLTSDAKLTDMIKRMEKELCASDAQVLREDPRVRKAVAKSAEAILKQAEALMA
jgi:hypothetical protein